MECKYWSNVLDSFFFGHSFLFCNISLEFNLRVYYYTSRKHIYNILFQNRLTFLHHKLHEWHVKQSSIMLYSSLSLPDRSSSETFFLSPTIIIILIPANIYFFLMRCFIFTCIHKMDLNDKIYFVFFFFFIYWFYVPSLIKILRYKDMMASGTAKMNELCRGDFY